MGLAIAAVEVRGRQFLALARNFRLGGKRNIQFRIEAFNVFNTVVYNARNTTLQVQSPVNLTASNPQYDASGNLVQTPDAAECRPRRRHGRAEHALDADADSVSVLRIGVRGPGSGRPVVRIPDYRIPDYGSCSHPLSTA